MTLGLLSWGIIQQRRRPMITGRPKKPIMLSDEEREQLTAITNSRSLPHGLVRRARIVLLDADGVSSNAIGQRVGVSHQSVCQWRKRYLEQGLVGLHDELRPGRPRTVSDEEVALLVRKTLETKPEDGTHWTIRTVAKESELSCTSVHRDLARFWDPAPSAAPFQALYRPFLCGEGERYCRSLSKSP